jgi:hypothetical protein
LQEGVEGEELADITVVEAGAQDGQAGVLVGGLAEEAVGVGPGRRWGAAGCAVGGVLAPLRVLAGGVEGEDAGALLVGELE